MRPSELTRGARIYGPFGQFRDPRLEIFSTTRLFAWSTTLLAAVLLVGLVGFHLVGALPGLTAHGWELVTGRIWYYPERRFGALAMLFGTLAASTVAMAGALPLGLGVAIAISEYLPRRARAAAKSLLELLAGVPSIVYGLLGVIYLRPWVQAYVPGSDSGESLLTAGLLLAVMVLPTVATLSEDALRGVPWADRDAARALGLTRPETIRAVVLPRARAGVLGACLLGLGRAVGETMAVYLVVGRSDGRLPRSPFDLQAWVDPAQTLTSKLGSPEVAIAVGDPVHSGALIALGLLLMALVGGMTLAGDRLLGRRG